MDLEFDVVVIGGGMAGLVAGTRIADAGHSVLLLQKGLGATSYSSGAIDVIGYLPDAIEPVHSPVDGLSVIAQFYPLHPYSIAGYTAGMESGQEAQAVLGQVAETVEWLKTHLENTLAPLEGGLDANLNPISVLGTTKPVSLLQRSIVPPADIEAQEDALLLFAGIRGYPDFNAKAAAKAFLRDRMINRRYPQRVAHCEVDLSPFGNPYNISGSEIAKHLDHDGAVAELVTQLKGPVDNSGATAIALPPILGIRQAMKNKALLEAELGMPVFELLGLPPSVPGLRLQKSLETVYTKAGGTILQGHQVVDYTEKDDTIVTIHAKGPSREMNFAAKAFVLASGKFIGGGLTGTRHGLQETVFDLMTVTGEFYSAEKAVPARSTSKLAISPLGQPLFSGGLSVDPHLRPVQKNGIERAKNLFCAGSILAGYSYSSEKSGLGVAATTGYTVASNVAGYLKEVA